MIIAPDELAEIRYTYGEMAPTEPSDILVWFAQQGLCTQHDHLVVDTTEWRTDRDRTAPAWHIGELGLLVSDLHHWTGSLAAEGYDTHASLVLSARSAAITALAKLTEVHQELASQKDPHHRPMLLGIQEAADRARHTLGGAITELGTHLIEVPFGAPRRTKAARSAPERAQSSTDRPARAAGHTEPTPGAARRR